MSYLFYNIVSYVFYMLITIEKNLWNNIETKKYGNIIICIYNRTRLRAYRPHVFKRTVTMHAVKAREREARIHKHAKHVSTEHKYTQTHKICKFYTRKYKHNTITRTICHPFCLLTCTFSFCQVEYFFTL